MTSPFDTSNRWSQQAELLKMLCIRLGESFEKVDFFDRNLFISVLV